MSIRVLQKLNINRPKLTVILPVMIKAIKLKSTGDLLVPLKWKKGLQDYFLSKYKYRSFKLSFKLKVLKPIPNNLEIPERTRLLNGEEIDRIGNTCYAAPSANSMSNMPGAPAAEQDRYDAIGSLFAHEVSCDGGENSFGDNFIKLLKKRGLIRAYSETLTH